LEGLAQAFAAADGEQHRHNRLLLILHPNITMTSEISFGNNNSGFQAGVIKGPVHTEFHHHAPPGKLQVIQAGMALTAALPRAIRDPT